MTYSGRASREQSVCTPNDGQHYQSADIAIRLAIVVGCLPSFAVFIRGRVAASRAQYDGSNTNPSAFNSHPKSRERTGSTRSQNDSPFWQLKDSGSDKSLVEGGGIVVTKTWSQKWHNPARETQLRRDRERGHELDTIHP